MWNLSHWSRQSKEMAAHINAVAGSNNTAKGLLSILSSKRAYVVMYADYVRSSMKY